MADNTQLPAGSGGDTVRTESLGSGTDPTSGVAVGALNSAEVKVQLQKLITGRTGVDGGAVADTNPLSVYDAKVVRILEDIWEIEAESRDLLTEILDCLKR
jgi:hypothetical protein